ncbi:MAG: hypothetical protein AAF517_08190, partial [Planctomycetota bacterium]
MSGFMYVHRAFAFAIGILLPGTVAFAQDAGTTKLYDFDATDDLSGLGTDEASFELTDGDRPDHGRALRVTFQDIPESERASSTLILERTSLPDGDFSRFGAIGFWAKNEGVRYASFSISVSDLNGKQSETIPSRVYVPGGEWEHFVCRLSLHDLDLARIHSIRLVERTKSDTSVLFDDFELYSPLAGRLALLEDQIRRSLENTQAASLETGLESFVQSDLDRLAERFRGSTSLRATDRLTLLSQLSREATSLERRIQYRQDNLLRLTGPQVTDAWLAACVSKIGQARRVHLMGTSITDAGLAELRPLQHLDQLVLQSPAINGSGLK